MNQNVSAGEGERRVVEVEARTVDEAVSRGRVRLGGLSRNEVEIEVLSGGRTGLLGFGSAPVRVRITELGPGGAAEKKAKPASGRERAGASARTSTDGFAAWVRLPGGMEFVSASPELLFEIEGDRIRSEPMKGTARPDARGALEHRLDGRGRQALLAVVRVDGHATQQAVFAVQLETRDADDAAVVLAHDEVVAPALAHVLVGKLRPAQPVDRTA